MKNEILDLIINRTKDNPIYSAEIENQLEISGLTVRDCIKHLRRNGVPIANSSNGYYFAKEYSEIEPTISDLHRRSMSMLETIKGLRKAFSKETQITIEFED